MYKELEAAYYALKHHIITPDQLEECVKISRQVTAAGLPRSVNQVLVEKRYLTQERLAAILEELGQSIVEVGPYEVLSKLGEGGMGTVYKVRGKRDGKIYALKTLKRELSKDADYLGRFQREIKIAMTLRHPNIAGAADSGEFQGIHYYAMDFIEGESLDSILEKKNRLDEKECTRILIQIADALGYAHRHHVIHRDIKPDNIMISQNGKAMLCDLGIARSTDSGMTLTQTGYSIGTPHFLSPEQIEADKKPDARSDIYSLGVTFFKMVTGVYPFDGDNPHTIALKRIRENPPSPTQFVPKLSMRSCAIILKMMARDPASRYQTLEDVKAAMEMSLHDGPAAPQPPPAARVPSSPPSPASPLKQFVGRLRNIFRRR